MARPKCPQCQTNKQVVRIAYGYPADMDEWSRLVEQKKIWPGSCIVRPEKYHCLRCGQEW